MDKTHKLTLIACVAAIVLLVGISAAVYAHYKHVQQVRANQAAQVDAVQAKAEAKRRAVFDYQLYLLDLQCGKDIAAAQATKKPLPVCPRDAQRGDSKQPTKAAMTR